jgi:hypothetical protein
MLSFDLGHLEEEFLEDMMLMVKSKELDKALRPEGFMGCLYVTCWPKIKHDIMLAFKAFYGL